MHGLVRGSIDTRSIMAPLWGQLMHDDQWKQCSSKQLTVALWCASVTKYRPGVCVFRGGGLCGGVLYVTWGFVVYATFDRGIPWPPSTPTCNTTLTYITHPNPNPHTQKQHTYKQ